jgi:Carboxypeptidase regulatory-like domain/TonB dependent receptor
MKKISAIFILILGIVYLCGMSSAQEPTASLTGRVTDQTGAVIPQATIVATAADGKQTSATADAAGGFAIHGLAPGTYSVAASAQGFALFKKDGVILAAGQTQSLNLPLQVQTQAEKVEVKAESGTSLDVSSSSGAGAIILKGKDLEALSDDPDELQSELTALAGPSAGPNGGQIYIDGFTGGQLPPKSAIREIRINQNPFSAQYDKLGYGRVEIFTKPGSDKYHGQFMFNDNNAILNSRNPYVPTKPDYNSEIFDGNFGGPIGKKASFFIDGQRRNTSEFSAINATILDLGGNPAQLQESIPNPRTRTNFSPRLDYQISTNNTLTARYQVEHETSQNGGLGTFSLPSQAYNQNSTEQTLQLSDSQILSPKIVNETRFQFQRDNNHQLPFSSAIAVQVQGAFSGGGSSGGDARTITNDYELQNYTSIAHGNHFIKFGGRFRGLNTSNSSNPNFNGTFVFSPVLDSLGVLQSALTVYQNALTLGCPGPPNPPPPSPPTPPSCPTQFSITTGTPLVSVNWFDAGLYAEDEWRIRPNLSFTYGLRFESQSDIHDHADFAPRLGIAWGLGDGKSAPKTVLRGGFGIFYDRFGYNLVQQAERLNGFTQQSIVAPNPSFFTTDPTMLPTFSQLLAMSTVSPTIYQIDPNVRAPYTMQEAASIERQVTKSATVSVTYLNSRGEHALYLRNINAPLNGVYPLQAQYKNDNVYQYDSEGVFRQNQLIANVRVSAGKKVSLFGFYTLGYASGNVSSGGGGGFGSGLTSSASFLSNSYDPTADYGRAAFDVRHRAFIGGSIEVPYGFRLSPFIIINSGSPYNITTGTDLNGDSIFNDRPVLVSTATCPSLPVAPPTGTVYCTPLGTFNAAPPTAGQKVLPVNYETGPNSATVNLRVSKTIGFGKEKKGAGGTQGSGGPGGRGGFPGGGLGGRGLGGGGGNPFGGGATSRPYNLTFSVSGRNIFNTVSPASPVGNLSSPFFGQSIGLGGFFSSASSNRRLDLQVMFSF